MTEYALKYVAILDEKRPFCFLSSIWGLEATYDVHLRLIENHLVDFLLVLIELFSLGVTTEAVPANISFARPGSVWLKKSSTKGRPSQTILRVGKLG